MLKKYIYDSSYVIQYEDVDIRKDLTVEERPIKILDQKKQVLRTKIIPLVKVC
jgi:hypothetical protein